MNAPSDQTIVLVHGLWMTPLAWEDWVARYRARGFAVLTPGYPGVAPGPTGVAALREDPSPLADLGVREVFDHLAEVIGELSEPPILMGHSFGGTFVQLLLDAGYGRAGVSIDGAGVKGIQVLPFSEIRATFPVLRNPGNVHRAVPITPEQFHYAFTNTLTESESQVAYERYAVPVPARILFQGGLANVTPHAATTYNFANDDRAPLLFIAGGHDHILPPAVQHENYTTNVEHSAAITAYKLFPERDHFTCGAPGWEEVADFALNWALSPLPGELD
ncbi:alpha/beta hydrolase [Mycobacterium sp. 4858]|uniref:alpha/beta hydrolase n=1 Tax=Mycobacterium sp. 4858 TaxID=2057185 RepID=UPI001E374A60|nr:alpha/beta hydrolase [Mycobacterium sp. 4858]